MIPWDDASAKRAKDKIWRKLGGPVLLDSDDQSRDFPKFLGIHFLQFLQRNNDGPIFGNYNFPLSKYRKLEFELIIM